MFAGGATEASVSAKRARVMRTHAMRARMRLAVSSWRQGLTLSGQGAVATCAGWHPVHLEGELLDVTRSGGDRGRGRWRRRGEKRRRRDRWRARFERGDEANDREEWAAVRVLKVKWQRGKHGPPGMWAKVEWAGAAWRRPTWVKRAWLDSRLQTEARQLDERRRQRAQAGGRQRRAAAIGEARRRAGAAPEAEDAASGEEEEPEAGWKRGRRGMCERGEGRGRRGEVEMRARKVVHADEDEEGRDAGDKRRRAVLRERNASGRAHTAAREKKNKRD